MANPYTNRAEANREWTNDPDYPDHGPLSDYAAPDLSEGSPYLDEPSGGWTEPINPTDLEHSPDAHRLGSFRIRDYYPDDQGEARAFYGHRDLNTKNRHNVEDIDANGWDIQKGRKAVGRNPREIPPPETRPTERMAPRSYSFTRPFDQNQKGSGERRLNGTHFSMADHRRNYEILGMQPWSAHRNTYRIEPTPWDTDIVDMPPRYEPDTVQARVTAVSVPPPESRSWRLS